MKHAYSRELYEHWNRLRGTARAPRRSAIEPFDLRRILGATFILEAIDPLTFRFRLAGTHLCSAYGRELKGEDFLSFWADEDTKAVAAVLASVTDEASGGVLGATGYSRSGRNTAYEFLLLPLVNEGPAYDRVLGLMAPMERVFWLGSDPIIRQEISSLRVICPDDRPFFLRPSPADLAQPVPPAASAGGQSRFTVLEGGKR